jgi:hypothetical protein
VRSLARTLTLTSMGALLAAQLVRPVRTNPPSRGDLAAPPEVMDILRHACYDCHSNQTRWPWYSAIAPVSWLVDRDVNEARRRLNFSYWADYAYDPGTRVHKLGEIGKLVANGEMAPWYYRMLHHEARLTRSQRETILHWIAHENSNPESPPG